MSEHQSAVTVTAILNRPEGALTSLTNGRHHWQSDLPISHGSHDAAPDPHDLYDSALAACTVLTLELYLRRKNWSVEKISCTIHRLSEEKAADGKVDYQVRREIRFEGVLDESQELRLMEIANKCPIHRLMEGRTHVQSVLLKE